MSIKGLRKRGTDINFVGSLLIILIVLFVAIGIANNVFFNSNYIINITIRNVMEIGLLALPMTLLAISNCIDFSIGATMILTIIAGGLVADAYGSIAGILAAILVGASCGLLNGLIIIKLKLAPIVVTFANMLLFVGIAEGITSGASVRTYGFATFMGNTRIAGLPLAIVVYAALAAVFCVVLMKTTFGRCIYVIGRNENTARYSGINVDRIKLALFVICGICCAVAGFFYLGRFTSIRFNADMALNLRVITIIVLGGVSVSGGMGDMRGTVIATLIIGVLNSGLTVLNIPISIQNIIHGSVLIISLTAYAFIIEKEKKRRIIHLKGSTIS